MKHWLLLGSLALVPFRPLQPQQAAGGSRLLESDHWAYEYLARLRSRGYLGSLDPLAQPYRRAEVARALSTLSADTLRQPVAGWVRLLRSEFDGELVVGGRSRAGLVLDAGARAADSDRLDPVRPVGDGSVWPAGTGGGWIESGALAAESRVLFDLYPSADPELRAPWRPRGGQVEHSYVSLHVPLGGVVLGRFTRNWAPAGTPGLLLSNRPLSYPQVGFEAQLGRFSAQAFTAELDTLANIKRYIAAHRLAYTSRHLGIAMLESVLYGGPGQSAPSLELLNPASVFLFDHQNPPSDDRTQNLMLGLQIWHSNGALELYGEGLLDDLTVEDTLGARGPIRYAATLGARFNGLGRVADASVEIRQVSAFAYRSDNPQDRYDYLGRGLGEQFADFRLVTVQLDLFPPPTGLRLSPTFQYLEQGEGDLRTPFPDLVTFLYSPAMWLGVIERTSRAALRGRFQPRREVWVAWDVGYNWARDAAHVAGAARSRFIALASVGVRWTFGTAIGSSEP